MLNEQGVRTTMNDEGNGDDYNGAVSWDVVYKEGLGSSMSLRQEG